MAKPEPLPEWVWEHFEFPPIIRRPTPEPPADDEPEVAPVRP